MMKKSILTLGVTTLVLGAFFAIPKTADAYKGDATVHGPNYTQERHEAMINAFENSDYKAWRVQVQGKGVASKINEGNFARFAKAHKLSLQGDTDGAMQIRAELGLGQGQRNGDGTGSGQSRN